MLYCMFLCPRELSYTSNKKHESKPTSQLVPNKLLLMGAFPNINIFGKPDRFLFLMQCTVVHYVLQGRKYCWLMINASCTVSHGLVHFILSMYNLQNPLYNLLQNTNFALQLNIEILNIETNFKIQLDINTAYGLPCNFS